MFVNSDLDEDEDKLQNPPPVSDSSMISKAFQDLRDFTSYVKHFNRTDIACPKQRAKLGSKSIYPFVKSIVIFKSNKTPLISPPSPSLPIPTANQRSNFRGSAFKHLVESKVMQRSEIIEKEELKPLISKQERNFLIRQRRQQQSIYLSKHCDNSSFVLSNIARTSQYKIHSRQLSNIRLSKFLHGNSLDHSFHSKENKPKFEDLLAASCQTEPSCVVVTNLRTTKF